MNGYGERALVVLATIAVIFLLHYGQAFFVPLMVALLISYALSPLVDAMTRVLRWRVLSATVVIAAILGLAGAAAWAWKDDVDSLFERVPVAAKAISRSLQDMAKKPSGPVADMKRAAAEIEAVAQTGKPARQSPPPQPTASPTSFWEVVWNGWKRIMVAGTQVAVVLFLVFFMLASGDLFKRKLVRVFGETLSEKKETVQVIDEIDRQIRKYLMVLLVSNVLVGLGTWLAFLWLGLDYPELWGMVAAIVHTAPYLGPAIIAVGSLVAGFLQFGDWPQALLVSGVSILVATLVGSVFATWLASRESKMNTTAVFIGLLFFGWIWGFWGVLLAIPILAIVKTICERNEDWKSVAELLSR